MLTEFINKTMTRARYKILTDGTYFGEIPRYRGVWANAKTLEHCRRQLEEVLEDWMFLHIRERGVIPGFRFSVRQYKLAAHAK